MGGYNRSGHSAVARIIRSGVKSHVLTTHLLSGLGVPEVFSCQEAFRVVASIPGLKVSEHLEALLIPF